MIRQSAVGFVLLLAAGACWTQTPAQAAKPAPATAPAPAQTPAADTWFTVYGHCRDAIRNQSSATEVDICKQALDMARKTGSQSARDQISLLQSYESYGRALLDRGRGPEALAAENEAVEVAKSHLHDSDQEYAMPYYWRALVESQLHDTAAASADLSLVEDIYRRAIMASTPPLRRVYAQYLARILRQHAALFDAMGKADEANKLRAQAATL